MFFSSPCNQILMARSSIPKTNKYIISIKPSHWQLNLKERFWVVDVNISYLNYFGWSFQGKINSFAVFTRYNCMFFINGYGPVVDIELGSMFRMSQTIHYNALVWKMYWSDFQRSNLHTKSKCLKKKFMWGINNEYKMYKTRHLQLYDTKSIKRHRKDIR